MPNANIPPWITQQVNPNRYKDKMKDKVYIVILNYNNWIDTIECVESLFLLSNSNVKIIVVDNASTDGSIEKLTLWSHGQLAVNIKNLELNKYVGQGIKKPISIINAKEGDENFCFSRQIEFADIILITAVNNGGFAAGNNLGIKFALTDKNCTHIWILNNDTVVRNDALANLLELMNKDPEIGMAGSTLLYYHKPNVIQARGGAIYNRWVGTSHHLGEGEFFHEETTVSSPKHIDYIVGASMLVSRRFVEKAGLMFEGYFLYNEEIDWACRRGNFKIGYAPKSIVYHKEGGTIGNNGEAKSYGGIGDYYLHRNRLICARRNFPLTVPTVTIRLIIVFLNSLIHARWKRAKMFLRLNFWIGLDQPH